MEFLLMRNLFPRMPITSLNWPPMSLILVKAFILTGLFVLGKDLRCGASVIRQGSLFG